MSLPSSSSPSSVDRALARYQETGDPSALAEVFDACAPQLLRVAGHLLGDVHQAEDLVQATFLVAIQHKERFQGTGAMPWLLGIQAVLAKKAKERNSRFLDPELLARRADLPGPADAAQASELSAVVTEAIAQLPEVYRPVLVFHLRFGLSAGDIAMHLGRPAATVYKQLERGMERLRRMLPSSLIAGTVVMTVPVKGFSAMREAVLTKAFLARESIKCTPASARMAFGSKQLTLLCASMLVTTAFGIISLFAHMLPPVAPAAPSPVLVSGHAEGHCPEMSPFTFDPRNQTVVSVQPPETMFHLPSTPSTNSRRIPPMLSFYPSNTRSCVLGKQIASAFLIGTMFMFPTNAPTQTPIYYMDGDATGDRHGLGCAAGDVDLDGYADIGVGAYLWDSISTSDCGRVYVYSGRNGTILFTFNGENASDRLGQTVSEAGDVNLDGYPDLVASARGWDDPNDLVGTGHGRMYVISGKDGSVHFAFNGENGGDTLGNTSAGYFGGVRGIGDVNLDGYPDVVAGATGWDLPPFSSLGRAYLISGKDGNLLFTVNGENSSDIFGASVSGAGDVDLDGHPDVVVGANGWDLVTGIASSHGRVYLVSGSSGNVLFAIDGENAGDRFGYNVGGGSDVSLDGYADVVIGAPDWNSSQGRAYLISGKDAAVLLSLNGESVEDNFGQMVSMVGDINADGISDLGVGAYGWDDPLDAPNDRHGRTYVFSGKDGSVLFTYEGDHDSERMVNVNGLGDVNQDGILDLAFGSYFGDNPYDAPNVDHGRVYVISGASMSLAADTHLLSIQQSSIQNLTLNAGAGNAGNNYWVFGNFAPNGSSPGVSLGSVNIPLNPDPWTQVTIDFANTAALNMTKGTLDGNGQASASLNSLAPQPAAPLGLTLQHCFLVYQSGPPDVYYMASNLVPWTTVP